MRNKSGPKTERWGTPISKSTKLEPSKLESS